METASEMAHAKLHLLMMSLPLSSVKRVVVRPLGWEWVHGPWGLLEHRLGWDVDCSKDENAHGCGAGPTPQAQPSGQQHRTGMSLGADGA